MFRYPQRYVKTEAEVVALICETENAIVRWGGKAQLDKVIAAEWDDAVAAGQVAAEVKEDARREAEYAEFPGLAAFIKSCGEPCRMVME
jgi:surface antigen